MWRLVAVLGSFRSDEIAKFGFTSTPELFAETARALGAEIARRGHRLLSAWSNDHLEPQFLGGKYRFEATADYHALMGYWPRSPPAGRVPRDRRRSCGSPRPCGRAAATRRGEMSGPSPNTSSPVR